MLPSLTVTASYTSLTSAREIIKFDCGPDHALRKDFISPRVAIRVERPLPQILNDRRRLRKRA